MKVNSNQQGMKNSTFIPDFALANIKIGCCYLPRVQLDEFNLLFNTMGASFSLVTEEALEIIKQWTGVQQIWKHQAKTQRSKKKTNPGGSTVPALLQDSEPIQAAGCHHWCKGKRYLFSEPMGKSIVSYSFSKWKNSYVLDVLEVFSLTFYSCIENKNQDTHC